MNQATATQHPIKIFQDGWQIYQKLLAGNYMFHQQINQQLNQFCRDYFAEPITVLELGCGDASQSIQLLAGLPILHYTGYDMSPVALSEAEPHLQHSGMSFSLVCDDMLAAVADPQRQVDLIFSSYALHHLPLARKRQLLNLARQRLKHNGLLILVDIVKDPQQSLSDFHDQYLAYADLHWTTLDHNELATVHHHVRNNDVPEDLAQYQQLAQDAGFTALQAVSRFTWHSTLLFHTQPIHPTASPS